MGYVEFYSLFKYTQCMKISYIYLQKKYPGNIVALDRKEKQVIAYAKKFSQLFKKLEKKHLKERNYVFIGPVQKLGINVY